MKHVIRLISILLLAVWLVPEPITGIGISDAHAQRNFQRGPFPNLLDMLFGGGLRKQRLRRVKRKRPDTRRVIVGGNAAGAARIASQPAPKVIVKKSENAQTVLVVGDFLADGLNWGLEQAYSENPDVVFVDKSSGLSGMVRDDVVDWPVRTPELIEEFDPVAVVIAVGMNDRQQIRMDGKSIAKLSDEWKSEYVSRINRLVKVVRDKNLPLIWLGLPPVGSSRMTTDYLVFNEMYRSAVDGAGGAFVDIWDGFTNAEGAFISAGPDVNGQIVRLRNSDGINMTNAGKRKLAFYAEKAIRRLTGIGSSSIGAALLGSLNQDLITAPEYDPAKTGKTAIISLDDPVSDGSIELDGATGFTRAGADESATSYDLVAKGLAFAPWEDRIDAQWGLPENSKKPEDDKADNAKADADKSAATATEPSASVSQ
ncbi:MAG: SGNH/GDSL hydrolase family protein [Rhizobiaceae bacterium]